MEGMKMIKSCETINHNGKPIPIHTCDQALPSGTKVPSKREAQLALDKISDKMAWEGNFQPYFLTLQRFLDTR